MPDLPRHASMSVGSLGSGLGQYTGGTFVQDEKEARHILAMMEMLPLDTIEEYCGARAAKFVSDLRETVKNELPLQVTGKRVFWLRDIKDRLIERGAL